MRRIFLAHVPPVRGELAQDSGTSCGGVLGFRRSGLSSGVPVAMAAAFVGVSRPKYRRRGWIAQDKALGLWKSGFPRAEEAARWLAKQRKVPMQSLARVARKKTPTPALVVSLFHGVVGRRRAGGGVLWETRVKGQPRRSFASQAEAAREVARARGVPVRSLAKKPTRLHSRRQFQAAYRVFKKYVPGDLMHTRAQEVECKRQFKQELCV